MFGLLGICLPVIVSGERCRSEINELVADDAHPVPTFDVQQFASSIMDDRYITSQDCRALSLYGIKFRFQELKLED